MADSPSKQKLDLVTYEVLIDGEEMPGIKGLKEIHVTKELNKIPTAKVVIMDGEPAEEKFENADNAAFEPGKSITIKAGYHMTNEVIFEGIITKHQNKVRGPGVSEMIVNAKDVAVKMTQLQKNVFHTPSDKDVVKDVDIFNKILGEYGVAGDVDDTTSEYEDLTQFNSTDWDFLLIRADLNGKVVVSDDGKVNIVAPDVSAEPVATLVHGQDLMKMDLKVNAEGQVKSVTANAWDFSSNEVISAKANPPSEPGGGNMDGDTLSDVMGGGDQVLHSPVPLTKPELQMWADTQLQKSRLNRISGTIMFNGLAAVKPNCMVKLEGCSERYNGPAYISSVSHHIFEGTWMTEAKVGTGTNWFADSKAGGAGGQISGGGGGGGGAAGALISPLQGLQIGKVKDMHTDPRGEIRVLVDVPMIDPSGVGLWARLTHFYATNTAGNFFMPEVGDEVLLGFLNNDPRFPFILGSLYSNTNVAPYEPDAENTYKAIVTKNQLVIEFEDVKKIIKIFTPNQNYMEFNDDQGTITIEDENKNKMVMSDGGIDVYTPKDFTLHADGLIKMTADKTIDIIATGDLTTEGQNITNKAGIDITCQGTTANLKGSSQTVVKGGMVMIN